MVHVPPAGRQLEIGDPLISPAPPRVRPGAAGALIVERLAMVEALPYRSMRSARRLAARIAADCAHLDRCVDVRVPGLTDLRPAYAPAKGVARG